MFSARIENALRSAHAAHSGQSRKGLSDVPYVTHVVHVGLILSQLGYDEAVISAGILHDIVEDCEGWTIERVTREFGPDVSAIVAELTEDKAKSWDERKEDGVRRVRGMSPPAVAVKAADKLHNLRCLVADLNAAHERDHVWSKFKGGRARTLEMSARLVAELEARADPRLARALRSALDELTVLAAA